MRKILPCIALAASLLAAQGALAQNTKEGPVSVTSAALVQSHGKYEPAISVPPGGKVLLKNTINNRGAQPAKDLVITNPVPKNMVFDSIGAIPEGTKVTYSLDGANFAPAESLTIKVVKNGAELSRQALPTEYRFVRWNLAKPLAAGASAEVSYNASVE